MLGLLLFGMLVGKCVARKTVVGGGDAVRAERWVTRQQWIQSWQCVASWAELQGLISAYAMLRVLAVAPFSQRESKRP